MEAWKSVVAVAVAGVFAVGPVWAQSTTTTPAPADKPAGTTDKSTPDKSMDKSSDKSGAAGADKMDKSSKGAMKGGGNTEQVKAVQQALKDKGHDPGPIDGKMGAKTKAALKDFQKAQGIKESGRLDNDTMSKLGVEMKTGAAGSSTPSASPSTDAAKDATKSDATKSDAAKSDSSKPADSTKPGEPKK